MDRCPSNAPADVPQPSRCPLDAQRQKALARSLAGRAAQLVLQEAQVGRVLAHGRDRLVVDLREGGADLDAVGALLDLADRSHGLAPAGLEERKAELDA